MCIGVYTGVIHRQSAWCSLSVSIQECWQEPACWVMPLGSCPPRWAPPPPVWCTASMSLTWRRKKKKSILHFQTWSISQRKAYLVKRPLPLLTSSSYRKRAPAGGRFSGCSRVANKNTHAVKLAFVQSVTRRGDNMYDRRGVVSVSPPQSGKKCLGSSNCYEKHLQLQLHSLIWGTGDWTSQCLML